MAKVPFVEIPIVMESYQLWKAALESNLTWRFETPVSNNFFCKSHSNFGKVKITK